MASRLKGSNNNNPFRKYPPLNITDLNTIYKKYELPPLVPQNSNTNPGTPYQ